jgi:hypothetical protein
VVGAQIPVQGTFQAAAAKAPTAAEAFALHRAAPALRKGIQIGIAVSRSDSLRPIFPNISKIPRKIPRKMTRPIGSTDGSIMGCKTRSGGASGNRTKKSLCK